VDFEARGGEQPCKAKKKQTKGDSLSPSRRKEHSTKKKKPTCVEKCAATHKEVTNVQAWGEEPSEGSWKKPDEVTRKKGGVR